MQLPQILSNQNIGAETNSANARELHSFLNSEQEFANWIKNRISQYNFIENQDYVIQTTYTGRRPRKEYFITLDMAKELCMVENNERGKEARQYFIKCEKELQKLKFEKYLAQISSLEASRHLQAKHHKNQINGYKSQIAQHNKQIATLKHELSKQPNRLDYTKGEWVFIPDEILANPKFKPFSSSHSSYTELFKEYIAVLGNNNSLKISLDHEKKADKDRQILLSLAKIQTAVEQTYKDLGAIMAFTQGDDYFIKLLP